MPSIKSAPSESFTFSRRALALSLRSLCFEDLHVEYNPAIVPIALIIPITLPAIAPPLRFDELLDPILAVSPVVAIVVEYLVRNTHRWMRRERDLVLRVIVR